MSDPFQVADLPPEITQGSIVLSHKPGASIHYTKVQGSHGNGPNLLLVFLNGLMTDQATWLPVIAGIVRTRKDSSKPTLSMLTYDRYGQGLTESRDPQDEGREPQHGHDVSDAAVDLHHLIQQLFPGTQPHLLLVGNSIGCAIARLYARDHPVAAVLFLDSIMANSSFDWWPNPDASDFDAKQLPEDVDVEVLREQRAKFLAIFSPTVPNNEGLSRRNLSDLLPYSDQPALLGDSHDPWVTVVGHDFETFAEEGLRRMGTPISLTTVYSNPLWHQYNEGLAKLTGPSYSKGPIQAKGCGHFIQRDDPDFVVSEVLDLVSKIDREA